MADKTYNSKIDAWLIMLTVLLLSSMLFRGLMSLRFSVAYAIMVLAVFGFSVLILLLFCYPCRYTLKIDHLLIQMGALRFRVDYADITRIEPSRSWWSGPALSLQRVRIDHGRRFVLVSPMQRDRFIAELQSRVDVARAS